MKKFYYFLVLFFIGFLEVCAQSGINTKTPKATFDVVANTSNLTLPSGFIAPRVQLSYLISNSNLYTQDLKGTIVFVYDVDESNSSTTNPTTHNISKDGYYYFDGSTWILFVVPDAVHIPTEPWKVENSGIEATLNNQNIVQNGKVGVGFDDAINSSAQFEVRSSDKGFLIPRLTTAERDVISNPTNSLMIFNTDSNCFEFYKVNKWKSLCGDIGVADVGIPNCSSAVILGDYKVGTVIGGSNFFQVTVNVVEAGNYSILVNNPASGLFFQKDGTFPNTGNYTIQVPATGTPLVAGINSFVITLNDEVSVCTPTVDVLPADVKFNNIVFVSADMLKRGESSTGKTLVIKVDVVNGGVFNFQTNSVNGLAYSAENVTLAPGLGQTVTLLANGNPPALAGDFNYIISGTGYSGTATVTAEVEVQESLAAISALNCSTVSVNGVLKLGTALTPTNYIDVPINATGTGTYNLTISNSQNPGFSYSASGTITSIGSSVIRAYGTGTPTIAGKLPFIVSINGVTCTLDLTVVIPQKKILFLGRGADGTIAAALNNTNNFGTNGKSKIEGVQLIYGGNPNAAQLTTQINNGVQIIMIGWGWNIPNDCATILANFIKNKKGFVFYVEAQNQYNSVKAIVDQAFGGNISMTNNDYGALTAKVNSLLPSSNPYLNGVFGDATGKYFRADDNSSWTGAVPGTLPTGMNSLVYLPSNGGSGTGTNSERLTEFYGDGFLMFSDWGFLNNAGSAYGNNSPIGFSTSATSQNSSNGSTVSNVTIPAGEVANWVIFGNAMDHIFNYVQQNFNPNGSL